MNIRKKTWLGLFLLLVGVTLTACKVTYSLSGGSLHPDVKTYSVAYIPNNAAMVAPILSTTLRDALQDRFMRRQSKLDMVREDGDISFEGEITNYTSTPAAISGDEYAVKNRLTITVKIKFTNKIEPQFNYDKSFSAFLEYDSGRMLQEVEPTLIPEIVEMLVDDIYNDAVANW